MSRYLYIIFTLLFASLTSSANAQPRGLAAGAFILDDGRGHTVTLVAPDAMTASYTYVVPSSATTGAIAAGTSPGQMLYWDGATWTPMNFAYFNGAALGLGMSALPATLNFPITLAANIGPSADSAIDIGDAAHRIRNVYAENIIGPASTAQLWQRIGTTISPLTSGDNITTAGSITATGTVAAAGGLSSTAGLDLAGTTSPMLLNGEPGNADQVLTSNGPGLTPSWTDKPTGTVTSVALVAPSELVVTGSPVTTNGTLTISKATQSARTVYAGPIEGGDAAPTFRVLASSDIPDNAANTTGTSANVTGTVAIANGGTGATSATQGINNLLPSQSGDSSKVLQTDGANIHWVAGSTGTVSSVGLSLPNEFSVTGSPVTTSGTISVTKSVQTAHSVYAGPSEGGAAAPTFRMLAGSDIPDNAANTTGSAANVTGTVAIGNGGTGATSATQAINNLLPLQSGDSGKVLQSDGTNVHWAVAASSGVSSVGLSLPEEFSVASSPITSSGTIAVTKVAQSAHTFYAGPDTGLSAAPAFRALVSADIPNNAANTSGTAANVTGTVAIANGGTGATSAAQAINNLLPSQSNDSGKVLQSDGTNVHWAVAASSGVSSVGLSLPAEFSVTGSPITSSGTLTVTKTAQNANTFYAGPTEGPTASPTFRALASSDIPDNAANTTGTALNVTGIVTVDHGGTGLSSLEGPNKLLYSTDSTTLGLIADGSPNDVLTLNGDGVPTWSSPNAATTSITFDSVLSGTSAKALQIGSGGTLTITGSGIIEASKLKGSGSLTDAVDLSTSEVSGTLAVANGGTGASTATAAINNLLPSQSADSGKILQTDGTNVHWVASSGNGSVTSVALSVPAEFSVSGSPITSSGTLAVTKTAQSANTIYAGPSTGLAAAPSFRPLVASDIPSLASSYISNTTSAQIGANFNIDGAGVIGTSLQVGSNALRVNASGNVGVGLASPNARLDIRDGNLLLSNTGTASQIQLQGSSSGISSFTAGAQGDTTINYTLPTSHPNANDVLTATSVTGTGPYAVALGWSAPSSGGGSGWGLSGNAAASGNFLGTTNAQDLLLKTNSTERLRILSTGKVGIGATSPSELLEVRDGNLRLSNSGTPAQLQLQGSGTGVTTFQAGAQGSTSIAYTLPTSQGVSGSTLQNNGSGTLSWSRVGQVLFGRRTENFNVTSTSLQSDTSLVVQLDSNSVYTFEAFLTVSDVNAAGISISIGIVAPTGSSIKWGYVNPNSALGTGGTTKTSSGAETGLMTMLGASEMDLWFRGVVVTSSTPGSLQMRLRKSGGAGTDAVRMGINSYLQAMRVK